jgi:hypothetical protein
MPREQAKKWKKGGEETGRKGWSGGAEAEAQAERCEGNLGL